MSFLLERFPWLSDPNLIIAQALSGVNAAVLVVLISLGISLIFGVARIVNLAHGSFYMIGAYVMSTLSPLKEGVGWFALFAIGSAAVVGILAAVFEITLLRKIYKKGPHLQILMTFGLLLALNAVVELIWGTEFRSVDRPVILNESFEVGGIQIPRYNTALIFSGAVLLLAFWLLIRKTSWGRYVRASSVDRDMLEALGVNANRISTEVFVLAGVLAGLAGALSAPLFAVHLQLGFDSTLSSFVVVVIGGLGNLFGVVWAAFLVSEAQAFGVLIAPKYSGFIPYIMMLVFLILRYGRSNYIYAMGESTGDEKD